MNLVRPRVLLVVALSVMIFTSTATVLVGLQKAPASFAADSGYVITSPGAPTIFSSSVDQELAAAINSTIQAVSPEVFAFASFGGVPFVVRGVDLAMLARVGPSFVQLERLDGGSDLLGHDALIGTRLMERLEVTPPYVMPIPSSYTSGFEIVRVVGWFESESSLDDELLVSLDVARSLSGMGKDKVSVIRAGNVSAGLTDIITPTGPRFALYGFSVSKVRAVTGEPVDFVVSVKNWGTDRGRVNLSIADQSSNDARVIARTEVALDAGAEFLFSHQLSLSSEGLHTIAASIDGGDSDSRSETVLVVPPYLRVTGPQWVVLNTKFDLYVTDYADRVIVGAQVEFSNQTALSDSAGKVRMNASELGRFAVNASYPGLANYSGNITVGDMSTYPNEFRPRVIQFTVVPELFKETETANVRMMVENDGRLPGDFTGTIRLDGSVVLVQVNVSLGPGESRTVLYPLGEIDPGQHYVALGDFTQVFNVQPWYMNDPDLVLLAVRYGGTTRLSSADAIPIVQAAKISQGDVEVALFSVGAISAALAALSMTSIFAKEVHEGRSKLGILRTIGASRKAIRKIVVKQSLAYSSLGAVAGVLLGLGLASFALRSGSLMMFGHSLEFDVDASLTPVILIGTLIVCLASSLASAEVAVRATPISSIRKTQESLPGPRPVDEILGDE